ncbi:helicase Cas3 [Ruminiclostridium hungatei]|uniref:Helicase Cas3 n=1 Tax=Ruminiclostridium hungatei TaxID=48256 RepID=A0A1V4SMQ6_RUMHU|nr:CRISPR-associated helicase/endonuclease Cas3 [Ruminiclostridium hungatei]OPX44511.1 helicase Cas3 [Ruminiclostridium hungatei]
MFTAHKRESDDAKQSVKEHLENTAERAREFASQFNGDDYAYTAGLLHDIGKYSGGFQKRILENGKKCDHSTAGAREAAKINKFGRILSYCIAGHHSGLPNYGSVTDVGIEGTLNARLNKQQKDLPAYDQFFSEIDLKGINMLKAPEIRHFSQNSIGFILSFYIRFIYSCLVDADFLDTEAFMSNNSVDRSTNYDFELFSKQLNKRLGGFKGDGLINEYRKKILDDCIEKAELGKNLFNLTVPTGGGKTLSSLAFAINHLIENSMSRIIYVIPYTSIIEQTARVFKDIFGDENVLEHHSNFDFDDDEDKVKNKLKLSSENWDMPFIVTTNVQFFESLFANKSSRCRKLHNIANSIIIFDEVQMFPIDYLKPCIEAIKQLVQNFNSTVVMCSATQPPFEKYFKELKPVDICENHTALYDIFKRTEIITRDVIESTALAQELNKQEQVLCIVNTRKHALKVFSMLKKEGSFHLSTLMCPAHRKEVVREIRQRLEDKLPCRVCSTRLIEAGVDVDFPTVFRAMSGLDGIIQAAGRCNREGRLKVDGRLVKGKVHVFIPEKEFVQHQPEAFKRPIGAAESIIRNFEDISSPSAIEAYFNELYELTGEGIDVKKITDRLERDAINFNFCFEDIAHDFKLIENTTIPIIIPYDEKACELIEKLRYSDYKSGILRSLQPYTVGIYENEFKSLFGMGAFDFISNGGITSKESAILKKDLFKDLYDKDTGLKITEETGIGIYI